MFVALIIVNGKKKKYIYIILYSQHFRNKFQVVRTNKTITTYYLIFIVKML